MLGLMLVFSSFLFITQVSAADTATVASTVTLQNVSVIVADGSVSYGTLAVSTSKSTITGDLTDTQTATNNGNVTEDLSIRGQNTAAWTLAGTAGVNEYVHMFCKTTCSSPPTGFTALTTNYQTLQASVAASGTQTFELRITTPSSSSTFTLQSADVTVLAVAS